MLYVKTVKCPRHYINNDITKTNLHVHVHVLKLHMFFFQANLKAVTNIDRELICFGDRHFRHTIFSKILRCLEESKVVVVVLSRNYCQSNYCKLEIEQAQLMRKPIILILTEHVKEEAMNNVIRGVFKNTTRARFVVEDGLYRLEPDWDQVCMSILQLI